MRSKQRWSSNFDQANPCRKHFQKAQRNSAEIAQSVYFLYFLYFTVFAIQGTWLLVSLFFISLKKKNFNNWTCVCKKIKSIKVCAYHWLTVILINWCPFCLKQDEGTSLPYHGRRQAHMQRKKRIDPRLRLIPTLIDSRAL